MKIAVVVPVALVIGLGIGTAAGRMMHPPEAPAAASDSAGGEKPEAPKAEGEHAAPEEKAAESHAGDSTPTPMTPVPLDAAPAGAPAAGKGPSTAEVQRMAKIFDRMPAQDAAALVVQMSDADLEGVLRAMEVAKSADLIAALPKERGAVLTKRLLTPAAKP